MNPIYLAKWIQAEKNINLVVPLFEKSFQLKDSVKSAELSITALGVFYAEMNGKKISEDVLEPGFTSFGVRLQYLCYDVKNLLQSKNLLSVGVGRGWRFHQNEEWGTEFIGPDTPALLCALKITYENGEEELILSDESWAVRKSATIENDIYNGETYDATCGEDEILSALPFSHPKQILLPLEGVPIREQERLTHPKKILTPKGETVLDFGQEITGYVEFLVHGKFGDEIRLRHFEVLDKEGNVYTENLRSAKQEVRVISNGKPFVYKPRYTFYGFRYIQVIGMDDVNPDDFTAIVVHSEMKRTSFFESSHQLLNRFYQNVIWGQKGNFLDIPTDCPQRDERLGWTGDAMVFAKSAVLHFNVEKFFEKWLSDFAAEQREDGSLPNTCPGSQFNTSHSSPGWTDAAIIIPWQMYLAYGHKEKLAKAYPMMKKYINYIASVCEEKAKGTDKTFAHPWTNGGYGDWLSLDNEDPEETNGRTDKGLIATAFLAYDLKIFIKVSKLFHQDTSYYESLYESAVAFFRETYMKDGQTIQDTQTAPVLALYFGLTDKPEVTAKQLADIVERDGQLTTGFIGTAYLLHALSMAGRDDLAVDLLLKEDYPSWFYPIKMGATTVWERWNGIHPDGHFANKSMNSFNHYAYGVVSDWIITRLAGIQMDEDEPAYRRIHFRPAPDRRIPQIRCGIETQLGMITIQYNYHLEENCWQFEFRIPKGCQADIEVLGFTKEMKNEVETLTIPAK